MDGPASDIRTAVGIPTDSLVVGSVSRVNWYRGIDFIIACAEVPLAKTDALLDTRWGRTRIGAVLASIDPTGRWSAATTSGAHEARALSLSIGRARHRLGWIPRLSFDETIEWTNDGYVAGGSLPRI